MVKERRAKAIFDCTGDDEHELTFSEGDIILNVEETAEEGWLRGTLERTGENGLFPENYVEFFEIEKPSSATPAKPATRSVVPVNGVTNTATEASKPVLPQRKVGTLSGSGLSTPMAGRVALPQLAGQVKSTLSPPLPSRPSDTAVSGGSREGPSPPPALPKRSNTMGSVPSSGDSNNVISSTSSPASIRERMANLSSAAASNQQHTPVGSGIGLYAGDSKLGSALGRTGAPVLPVRPNATNATPSSIAAKSNAAKPNAAPSPLSSAARPALPPRTSTGSSLGSSTTSKFSSSTSSITSSSSSSAPRSFQVEGAEAPAPKLTTFARPRSARSSKAASPSTSPKEEQKQQISSIMSTSGSPGGAPKLPARSSTSTSLQSTSSSSATTTTTTATSAAAAAVSSGSTGPVRFAAARHGSGRDAGSSAPPPVVAALPAISRNAQPLPLPSRPTSGTNPAAAAGSTTKQEMPATTTTTTIAAAAGRPVPQIPARNGPHESHDSSAAVAAPPPLPARSNTIAISGSEAVQAPAVSLPERSASVRQSPGFKYQPVASQQYLKHGASQTNVSSSTSQQDTMPGAFQVGRPTLYKGGQRLNGSSSSLGSDLAGAPIAAGGVGGKNPWAPRSIGPTPRGVGLATVKSASSPPSPAVGIPPDALRRYEALFESKVGQNGYIDGVQVYAIYVRSRLDSKTLAQIWDLVDVSCRGALDKAQFCMGLYLIDERLGSGVIPLEVSPELWASARSPH
ncbi:Increased rDNA silencing protein [Actinomortierella wolfii]|nr:Increased rDNA silencing protein [Actinomortierella wolfii]